ncbi:NlpC/P60 family protein [Vibrio phage 1.076.O._10N.286.51.B7]|nr:NlpC/P60 family protein [Vibrio phage 1.076.O._10N.286.51.B7]
MKAEDYINSVIGKPWVNRAEGPDAFDCWGLVLDSFRKIDGFELPQIDGYVDTQCKTAKAASEAIDSGSYIKCEPHDGAIMTAFIGKKIVHVGRCLCGGVLHTSEGMGSKFDKYRVINALNQRVEYFKYAPNTAS